MKLIKTLIAIGSIAFCGFAFGQINGRKMAMNDGPSGVKSQTIYQPIEVNGRFQFKKWDASGNIIEWYQDFKDKEGKVLISITRKTIGSDDHPPFESIQFIIYNVYNSDENVAEQIEFYGDGKFRERTVHQYDSSGKWIKGLTFDENGKSRGILMTPPEAFLYGYKRNHRGDGK